MRRFLQAFNLSFQRVCWKARSLSSWRVLSETCPAPIGPSNSEKVNTSPNISEDGFRSDPFAKSLPPAETAQKTKVKKTAAAKILMVLSFLTILQTMTV